MNSFWIYDENSDDITLWYELENVHRREGETCRLSHYKEEFSSIVKKEEFSGKVTFKKTDSFLTVKERISEITGFPKEVMINFGTKGKSNIDENGTSWLTVDYYTVNDSEQIKNSKYNQKSTDDRSLYIYIDIDESPNFKLANKIQLENDKTFENINNDYKLLKNNYNDLKDKYNKLNNKPCEYKWTISTLQTQIETMKKNNEEINTNIQNLKTENNNLKTENNNLKTELEKLKEEISTIKSKLTKKEEDELKTKNNEIEYKKKFDVNLIKYKEKMINEYKTKINNIFKIFINSFEKKEKIENNFS